MALSLAALFVLWVQLHPGFPAGLILILIWAIWQAVNNPGFRWRELLWLGLPLGALLLNPRGFAGAWYPFEFATNEAQVFRHNNFEWFPAYHPAFRFAPETLAFWALSAAAAALITRARAWRSLRAWFAVGAFVLAASTVRFVPWAAFVILLAIKPWCELHHVRRSRELTAALSALLIAVAVKNFALGYTSSSGQRLPGFGFDPKNVADRTLSFLRAQPIPGRLYNTHDLGAQLVWEGFAPIFHHGFVTDMEFYRDDVLGVFQSQARFLELARKYGWTMLLVDKSGSYKYFWQILSPLPEWQIVAEDDAAYLIYKLPQ